MPPALLLVLTLGVANAGAQSPQGTPGNAGPPDAAHGRILYLKHCRACHGAHAWGDGPREIPALAGQSERYLLAQLTRFASGVRGGSFMHGPLMHDVLGPADMNRPQAMGDVAAWLAQAPRSPQPEYGTGTALTAGQQAYARACAGCHGERGSAAGNGTIPRIAGQQYRYLLSQIRSFDARHRNEVEPALLELVGALADPERAGLADYVSRLLD